MTKTPSEKWQSEIITLRKICQTILDLSPNIRYVGVINSYGRTITGIIKSGVKPLLKSELVKNEFFVIATLMSLRKNVTSAIGKIDYVLLTHQKVNIVLIQKNDITYYISINKKESNIARLVSKISQII